MTKLHLIYNLLLFLHAFSTQNNESTTQIFYGENERIDMLIHGVKIQIIGTDEEKNHCLHIGEDSNKLNLQQNNQILEIQKHENPDIENQISIT